MKAALLTVLLVLFMWPNVEAPAQEKAPAERAKHASAPAAPVPSAEYRMGGIITRLDPAAGKISIRQRNVKRAKDGLLEPGQGGGRQNIRFPRRRHRQCLGEG